MRNTMRRSASEVIRELERRIARLESNKTASSRVSKKGEKILESVESAIEAMLPDLVKRFEALEDNPIVIEDEDDLNPMLGNISGSASYLSNTSEVVRDALKGLTTALELIHETEERITELEEALKKKEKSSGKKARLNRISGRRFDADEWIFFVHQDHPEIEASHRREAESLRDKFESRVDEICDDNDFGICYDEGVSEVSWKAYATLAGEGTGLWDMDHPEAGQLERLVNGDRELGRIFSSIESLPYNI